MLKQTLSQKMLQKLSPQQIQLMKLLQIPTAALEERIKEEMEVNPALEESEREAEDMSDFETPQEDNFDYQNDEDTSDPEQDNYREESLELENYLNDYLDDDPGSYKLRDENYGAPEEEKQRLYRLKIPFTITWKNNWVCCNSGMSGSLRSPARSSAALMKTDTLGAM